MPAICLQDTAESPQLPLPFVHQDEPATLACHRDISTRGARAQFFLGGRLLKVRAAPRDRGKLPARGEWLEWSDDPEEAGRQMTYALDHGHAVTDTHVWTPFLRSPVSGFTLQSRMRLLCKINMLASRELPPHPKFVTLTYPRELLPSWEWAKRQLNTFLWKWFRKYGRCAVLWRMEHQEDGSLHFHLLLWVTRFIPWRWVAREWDGLIGNQVEPEDSASTQIQGLKSFRQAACYVAKYIAKDSDESAMDVFHGRHWGSYNWHLLPVHMVTVALAQWEFFAMRRWVRRFRLARGVRTRTLGCALPFCHQSEAGLTMFLSDVDVWRLIHCLRGYGVECLGPPKRAISQD